MSDSTGDLRAAGHNRGLYVVALLTALCTFPLIFMGGLVTSHRAGLAVPDWPNTFGYNMFTFPISHWVGGVFYEHTHRLAGTLVGMLALLLAGWAYFAEPRRRVRWLTYWVLIGVIAQGVLGGLRVVLVDTDLAIIHGCVAQAFFCLTILAAMTMSRWWRRLPPAPLNWGSDTAVLALAATAVVFLQLICGAVMRHYDAGLAIPDLPLAYGRLLPPLDGEGLYRINAWRAAQTGANLEPVTLVQVWVHFAHRVGALAAAGVGTALIVHVLRRHRGQPLLVRQAWLLAVLLAAQLTLGVLVVLLGKPADIASYHVAVGAGVLASTFVISVRAARLVGAPATQPAGIAQPTGAMAS